MKRIVLGLGLLAGFLTLQLGEVKADHWDYSGHNHGRSSLPAYRRELNRAHSHQMPMTSVQSNRLHDAQFHDSTYLYRNSYPGNSGYSNYGTRMNRIYTSPSTGCDTDWNYGSNPRSHSIYQSNTYPW